MRWTEKEIETTILLLKQGKNYSYISSVIGRSENSIRTKLFNIGEKWSNYSDVRIENICPQCNNTFIDFKTSKRKFCSRSCSTIFYNLIKSKSKKSNKCLNCSKEIESKYCSNKCQFEYNKKIIFEKIENGDKTLHEKQYKKYLIDKYGNKCMECGWNKVNLTTGKIPIQIEHIDGNSENNNLENLKLLCPNCHSLTPTYGSLNKGRGRKGRYKNAGLA